MLAQATLVSHEHVQQMMERHRAVAENGPAELELILSWISKALITPETPTPMMLT